MIFVDRAVKQVDIVSFLPYARVQDCLAFEYMFRGFEQYPVFFHFQHVVVLYQILFLKGSASPRRDSPSSGYSIISGPIFPPSFAFRAFILTHSSTASRHFLFPPKKLMKNSRCVTFGNTCLPM